MYVLPHHRSMSQPNSQSGRHGGESSGESQVAPSATDREAVMSALGDAYAADQLELDELERRMARVYRATSHEALGEVLAGLGRHQVVSRPYAPSRQPERPQSKADMAMHDARAVEYGVAVLARPELVPLRSAVVAIMGGAERKGGWVVPKLVRCIAVMGGVDLDMREAQFAEGVTEIEVFAMFGGVDISVPTGVRVETTGLGIMGGFSVSGADADPGPNAPVLRISGAAIMGGVDAKLKKIKRKR